jgi:c-di-GMP-binding flagellar brake protein YcgR
MPHSHLTPVYRSALQVGRPLARSIYNATGDLLLSQGYVIETESQVESLVESGYFKSNNMDPQPSGTTPSAVREKSNAEQTLPLSPNEEDRKERKVALDEVRWQIGETFFLHQQGAALRYTARFIGYIKNKTVLVTMPVVEDKYVLLREGQTFVVRAFSGKKAYAFSALATKVVHTPHPYLHLSYPRELSCATIRRRARIPVNIIASVNVDDQPDSIGAVIMDMSLGGASAVIKHPYGEIGQRGRMKFKINAVGETVLMNVSTLLRSIAPVEGGKGCRHGYEFVDLSTHDRLVLSAFFHQAEVER